jgi:EAL domain-containing protein (putative c-di-GMP-specific phosphodiesterase class I)
MGASIGVAIYPHDGRNLEALVSNADIAMYRAKEEGRNLCKLFTPSMNTKVVRRLALENDLRGALARKEFLVQYQPKVDLGSGRMVGVEALVRWQRPGVGLAPPDEFIPIAEETGLIVPLGQWVLRTACRRARQWREEGYPHLQVAVNLSPRQFQQKNLVGMIRDILNEVGLPAESLELEITEGVVMQSVEDAIETLQALKKLGVQLSMDDFGRGYSSLYYLKRFPMSALKIDRSFVADITKDPDDASIVNTIISMSRSLNLKVIAEGVETAEQLDFLRANSCDQMQGFLFSEPVDAERISELLAGDKRLA